ncbi:MAG: GDYXXLXY domain-containing protein [Rhizobiaceae bacterium]|nr:GDYXXLXY domain-containing protein [Rhizobiaceae bacterium]
MKTRYFLLAALIAGSLQTIALGSIIYDRAQKLATGQEVLLQSMMRDPRDLFRGHYTRLNLEVGELKTGEITVVGKLSYGDDVYVELVKGEDIFWIAKTLYAQNPQRADIALIKGRIISRANRTTYRISFPFDRYFAAKDRALELEDIGRDGDRKLGVILALDGSGAGQIKGISIDDKLIYEEPLY